MDVCSSSFYISKIMIRPEKLHRRIMTYYEILLTILQCHESVYRCTQWADFFTCRLLCNKDKALDVPRLFRSLHTVGVSANLHEATTPRNVNVRYEDIKILDVRVSTLSSDN